MAQAPKPRIEALVLAAGAGRRLGQDKALAELGGCSLIERVCAASLGGGCAGVVVLRQRGAGRLPALPPQVRVVEVDTEEMIESAREGLRALTPETTGVLLFPVDYALVDAPVVQAIRTELAGSEGASLVLPISRGRPGHPIGLSRELFAEVLDPATDNLREVVRRDAARVRTVEVESGWVRRDIDEPADLRGARGYLANRDLPVTSLMARHRSRRSFAPDAVSHSQLEWLIDSARHASTSSYMQAAAVVVLRDPQRKAAAAKLCADQPHIHQAPVFLCICADLHRIAAACAKHGKQMRSDSLEIFVQATIDAALFGQNLQLAAESEGLGSCMIGAARNHPVELAELLELPQGCYVAFGMTLGWPGDDPLPRGRMPLQGVMHDERYRGEDVDSLLDLSDEGVREWARRCNARDPGAKPIDASRGWSDRMAWLFGSDRFIKGREALLAELRRLGFGLGNPD